MKLTKFLLPILLIPLLAWGQSTDRLSGLSTSVAVKPPVKAVSTGALTLEGEQTVDGVAVVEGDRVLVKDQADAADNGIYKVSETEWTRAEDFDGNRDVVDGTLIVSNTGSNIYYRVTTDDPIVIGTSEIEVEAISGALTQAAIGAALYPRTAAEIAASVTPSNYAYPQGYTERYGATCDGVADDTAEIQAALNVAAEDESTVSIQLGTCLVDTLTFDASNITIAGRGRGSILKASTDIPASGGILVSLAGAADATVNQALLDGIYGASVIDVRTNVTGSLENVQLRDFTLEGNAAAIRGIWATGFTRGCRIEGVYFDGIDGDGVALNGSWSFTLAFNHFEGDGTNGTGISLGRVGNGERSGSIVVNAANIIGNEVTGHANGMIWNFGVAGFVGGNIFEFNVTDGFNSQSVEGLAVVGNYFEQNGGDNLDMGGTTCDPADLPGTDCAEAWVVSGNQFTSGASDENIRLDGVVNSTLGPNNFGGDQTQHYLIPAAGGGRVAQNTIVVPDVSNTYISSSSELSGTTNIIVRTLAGSERFSPPRLTVPTEFRTGTSSLVGFYGATAVDRPDAVTAPSGGATQDAEARTAINTVITRLEELGLLTPN